MMHHRKTSSEGSRHTSQSSRSDVGKIPPSPTLPSSSRKQRGESPVISPSRKTKSQSFYGKKDSPKASPRLYVNIFPVVPENSEQTEYSSKAPFKPVSQLGSFALGRSNSLTQPSPGLYNQMKNIHSDPTQFSKDPLDFDVISLDTPRRNTKPTLPILPATVDITGFRARNYTDSNLPSSSQKLRVSPPYSSASSPKHPAQTSNVIGGIDLGADVFLPDQTHAFYSNAPARIPTSQHQQPNLDENDNKEIDFLYGGISNSRANTGGFFELDKPITPLGIQKPILPTVDQNKPLKKEKPLFEGDLVSSRNRMSQFKGNTRGSLIPVVPRAIYSKESEKNASSAKLSLKSMKSLYCCGILLFCLFFIVVLLFLLWPRNPVLVITNFSLNNTANSNGSFDWVVGAVLESRNFYDLPFTQVNAKVSYSNVQIAQGYINESFAFKRFSKVNLTFPLTSNSSFAQTNRSLLDTLRNCASRNTTMQPLKLQFDFQFSAGAQWLGRLYKPVSQAEYSLAC